jgi:hypothetical protein
MVPVRLSFKANRQIWIWRPEVKKGEAHRRRTSAARSAALEVYGSCSGDLLALGKSGRCAGWHGKDGSEVGDVVPFLELRGGVTGERCSGSSSGLKTMCLICCTIRITRCISACARAREGGWDQREALGLPGVAGIKQKRSPVLRVQISQSVSLAA